jgi:hypothetical protein
MLLGGQKLEINLMANWGHPALIGSAEGCRRDVTMTYQNRHFYYMFL